jgi:putative ubiquitin-RnfH superfamily antitoxin RatB of RatAB toxin-antitoxin module
MHRTEQRIQVVLVSPGDVTGERDVARTVVDELNRGVAADRGCRLSLWRWETDARPGMHLEGPQSLIDELMDIQYADVVVGTFWKRFGTPTGDADSGTEHELRRAWTSWSQHGRPEVMVYFCTRAYFPQTRDELAQWGRVLEFRDALPEEQFWWTYESVGQFEGLLREHLTRFVLSRILARDPRTIRPAGSRLRFNLPTVVAAFTGRRDELGAIDEALGVADRAVITQSISGLGGVGKSQLAARYVQQHADNYDVVAWIGAEDGGIADLHKLAAKLGLHVDDPSPSVHAQLALDWLSDCNQRWLLVLDNIESAAQLKELHPRGGNGRVLVTSRDRSLRQFGPVLTIDVFDEDTATAYLTDRAQRWGDVATARQLARSLGCLPLALAHAAAYCQSGTTFTDYGKLLGELPARELFDSNPELSYAQTVASTWKASIQAASKVASLAGDVLDMAAHLAPHAIPRSLFEVLIDVDTARGRKRLADALNALARFCLASVHDDTVGVHRLLQKVVRDDAAARDDQTAALRALAAMTDAFPSDGWRPACWPLCERLLPHVLALADTLTQPGDSGPQLIALLNRACWYLTRAEAGQRGVSVGQRALAYANHLLGPEHPETLRTRNNLAWAYQNAGRGSEVIAIWEPLLADAERILGSEHPQALGTRLGLAGTYQDAGRDSEAIAIYEPLLADAERILGSEHPETLRTRHNLAWAYQSAGRDSDAIAIYEPLLADRGRILGAEHAETLLTRRNLALAYQDAGRGSEAITIYEPLLAEVERILGSEHPQALGTRLGLAWTYQSAGRDSDAIAIYEPLLADLERILGSDHPETLRTRNNLAWAYQSAGRGSEAITVWEPLLADRERILGAEHPETLRTRNNLAWAYQSAGRDSDAIAIYEPLLADAERILGSEHLETLSTRNNLVTAYQHAGRSLDAERIQNSARRAQS